MIECLVIEPILESIMDEQMDRVETTFEITPLTENNLKRIQANSTKVFHQRCADLLNKVPLKARVDRKTGLRVLCGSIACGCEIALIHRSRQKESETSDFYGDSAVSDFIQFPPGWAPQRDGVWALSSHARQRAKYGRSSHLRRYPKNQGIRENDVLDQFFDALPVAAVCSKCGFKSTILPDVVSVSRVFLIIAESQ